MKKVLMFLLVAVIVAVAVFIIAKFVPAYNSWWLGVIGDFFSIESTAAKWAVAIILDAVVTIGIAFCVWMIYGKFF